MSETVQLAEHHRQMLTEGSGIAEGVIAQRGYRTITNAGDLHKLGFSKAQCRVPGLLLPSYGTDKRNGLYIYRPDNPRVSEDKKGSRDRDGNYKQKVIKYEFPKDEAMRLDCPPACFENIGDPSKPLWITEGQKKADALASRGACAIALLGVWNFKGKNDAGGTTFLADWDYVALKGRDVRIVFDSDVMTKPAVRDALARLTEHLHRKGAQVSAVYLPKNPEGKTGVDDYLVAGHSLQDLETLAEAPRPEMMPAASAFELVEDETPSITRPLALIGEYAYACAWPQFKKTTTEIEKKGEIIRLAVPLVQTERHLVVLRSDGMVFGPGGDKSIDELGMTVTSIQPAPMFKTLDAKGIKAYRAKERPAPADQFGRMVKCVDHFVSFVTELGTQEEMCRLAALVALASWFAPAFNVSPFIYFTGERGSGKTKAAKTITRLGHLGITVTQNTTLPALRDTCSLGGVVAADDVEALTAKEADVNLRAMLLASNRRGAFVPLQEPNPAGGWQTKYLDAFGIKLFTAIRQPDATLGSRCIVVSMAGADDDLRANRNEEDDADWPYDLTQMHRDAWLMALQHLPTMPALDKQISANPPKTAEGNVIAGRALDAWRPLLAVALWLEGQGVSGIYGDLCAILARYQDLKFAVTTPDLTTLVAHTLIKLFFAEANEAQDGASGASGASGALPIYLLKREKKIGAAQVLAALPSMVEALDVDFDTSQTSDKQVGKRLTKLLPNGRGNTNRDRSRRMTEQDAARIARAYSIKTPHALIPNAPLAPNAPNAPDAAPMPATTEPESILAHLQARPLKASEIIRSMAKAAGKTDNEIAGMTTEDPFSKRVMEQLKQLMQVKTIFQMEDKRWALAS